MKILAIDPGLEMGFAYNDEKKPKLTSGVVSLGKSKRWLGAGMPFLILKRWLITVYNENSGFDALYFEEVRRHKGTDAAHYYGGFKATIMSFCEEYKIPYESVPVGTIKKFIVGTATTGGRSTGKKKVIDAVREKGYFVEDDNEADAIAIWFFAEDMNSLLI